MTIYFQKKHSIRELSPRELLDEIDEGMFYTLYESNGNRADVSGNKLLNQMGRLTETVLSVAITPMEN